MLTLPHGVPSGPETLLGAPGRWMPLAKRVEMSLRTPDVLEFAVSPQVGQAVLACPLFRPPDLAPQFLPGGENGLSHSFRWRELRRWGKRCRLPARAELGPLLESDRAKARTACPTCGLPANSTTSGVLIVHWRG